MRLAATDDGITYEIDEADTSVFRDVAEHIDRGDVSGASFAFRVTDERFYEEGDNEVREIIDGELFDIGPVTYPAYAATDAGVASRCYGDDSESRAKYDAWKASKASEENEIAAFAFEQERMKTLKDI